ncbi:tetratricopeptide repeat protein [Pseudohalioglobus sediminis]|uniref:Tetratricopeptide repeat protein n=1 Tax=Pseudohalioglobus sediminis TaxID=2606449 RepID=A0A5B0X5K8_9GAMM|nr:sulfotransferase [Pseudohalioglobus sediminis]KAA1193965.1 tetratricopeptide repeat protein [Pseudohalioglobus sediminis]
MEISSKAGTGPQQLEARVLAAVGQGNTKQAIISCRQLNRQFPGFASGWYTASQLAARVGNARGAVHAIDKAIALEPDNPRWQLQKAACLMRAGDTRAARPIVEKLDKLDLSSGFQCAQLALQLSRLNHHERALHHYQRAIRLEPDQSEHHYNLASVHRFLGNFNAAEQALQNAISLNPRDFEAYKLRSDLRTQTTGRNNLASLHAALDRYPQDHNARVQLNFSLAKEYEDLQQWQQAFQHLAAGAAARRQRMRYDVSGDVATMREIAAHYDAEFIQAHQGDCANEEAIFVLGMPRTGTTLVERIFASHSSVSSAGELNNFALEMSKAARKYLPADKAAADVSKLDRVVASTQLDFSLLGQQYIDSTRPVTGSSERFIDKMPLNFLYVGLIHMALPQAKIVHLERHPLDTCFAVYKTLFADAYPFSYHLEELGEYYAAYRQLMAHWHQAMPGLIYNQSYEALVTDFEPQTEQLLAHCGLALEPACLDFHTQQQPSTTASATQVRQPVYTSSVAKWRKFRDPLSPLIKVLESRGIDPRID